MRGFRKYTFRNIVRNVYDRYQLKRREIYPDDWHSWDPHPWKHPWLTSENLSAIRDYSRTFRNKILEATENQDGRKFQFGFCGNIANNLYLRASPLRKQGLNVTMFLHPQDNYVMSHPCWEEYDGILSTEDMDIKRLTDAGLRFPHVNGVECYSEVASDIELEKSDRAFIPFLSDIQYRSYMPLINTLRSMQRMDSLLCAQVPYVGYLSGRPYVATQIGGDIWFDASRNDMLGQLQRISFKKAAVFIASNPWSFAHARRLGFSHFIYLPLILDEEVYAPGIGGARKEWQAESGGDFFILTTSRLDETYKGSAIGLEGVAAFIQRNSGARLVVVGWGKDKDKLTERLKELNIFEKVIKLPVSGKARIRDYLRSADCFLDQFVLGYFGGAGLEALASGLPVIGRIETIQYENLCETGAPPILNAQNAVEVFQHLIKLSENSTARLDIANAHRRWFLENHSAKRWLPDYQAILMAVGLKTKFTFRNSPLRISLSKIERDYHATGLNNAPVFPNYTID